MRVRTLRNQQLQCVPYGRYNDFFEQYYIKALKTLPQIDKGGIELCVRKGCVSYGLCAVTSPSLESSE